MSHARQQIREALATAANNLTTTEDRVYQSPVYPSGDSHLPGLNIFTLTDKVVRRGDRLRNLQWRELEIEVQARAKPPDGTDLDDQLDDICAEVQAALMGDPTLGGLVRDLYPGDVEMALSGDLERPVGVARMTWRCRYLIDAADPTTILGDS